MAVGTNLKFYIEYGSGLYDITPLRQTFTPLTNPFSTTISTPSIKMTITAHGAAQGDFVTISGVTGGPYGGITAAQLNGNQQVTSVIDANNFTFNVSSNASATVNNTGGSGITAAFEIGVGLAVEAQGTGWGAGPWGGQAWGTSSSLTTASQIRLWSSDKFGQDLVFNAYNAGIYYLNNSSPLSNRAVTLASICADPNTPTVATWVCVTSARHMMIFGTNPVGTSTQDPMWIRWSDQENITGAGAWTASLTNQAGGIRLTDGSNIITVKQTLQQTLVWTNTALYALTFVGTPFIYSLQQTGQNISIIGPNSAAVVSGTTVYWMGNDKFYMYNGVVNTLPSDLRQYVFTNMNPNQTQQVFAFTVERFNEVWWLYPSVTSYVNDSYVSYNYLENVWSYGTITRTAWIDTPIRSNPVAAGNYTTTLMQGDVSSGLGLGAVGNLYYQEFGNDAQELPAVGTQVINPYIESADMDIMDGEKFVFIRRMIPDVSFTGSTSPNPKCNITIYVRRLPGVTFNDNAPTGITESATVPVEQYTSDSWIRLRGRQMKLRIDSNTLGTQWQLGTCRLGLQPDGKR